MSGAERMVTAEEADKMAINAVALFCSVVARMYGEAGVRIEVKRDSCGSSYETEFLPLDGGGRVPTTYIRVSIEQRSRSSGPEERTPSYLSHVEPY